MKTGPIAAMTASIVEAHHATVGLPPSDTSPTEFSHGDAAYQAAKQASRSLGFVESDAECIATAWLARTKRIGTFDARTWPDDPRDFDLAPHPRAGGFATCPRSLGLYAVLPDAGWIGRMARAGVPTVQLRFKSENGHAVQREVEAAIAAVHGTGARLFINDHWEAAIDAGAYGVHLGQEDIDLADMDAIRKAGLRLGISTHGYAEMVRADRISPSYIAMGAVYATTLKQMATVPQGPGRLGAYSRLMRDHSLVAIGGIDAHRLPEVLASGVGSVALVRALLTAENPELTAANLMHTVVAR